MSGEAVKCKFKDSEGYVDFLGFDQGGSLKRSYATSFNDDDDILASEIQSNNTNIIDPEISKTDDLVLSIKDCSDKDSKALTYCNHK